MADFKILLACNTLSQVHGEIYHNHSNFFYRLGKDLPHIEFHQFFAKRMSIDRFRNNAVIFARQFNCKYILFIDDDMKLPKTTAAQLLEGMQAGYHILSALTYIRGYPFDVMSYVFDEETKSHLRNITDEEVEAATGSILNVDAIGTATCMIDVYIFDKIPPAWFITGPHNTEDIYFCMKAREHVEGLKIGTHTGIIVGHMLDPESIQMPNKKQLMAYMESFMTADDIARAKKLDARGIDYIKANVNP